MKKPAHANANAPVLGVTVFERGKRHKLYDVTGNDPVSLARKAAADERMPLSEKKAVRDNVRKALKALVDGVIPNVTTVQVEVAGRRVRVHHMEAA